LSGRSPESRNSFHTDVPCVVVQSIWLY